ncbi:MAG: PEP-CTERM system histidine kinase PrsK, partial [Gammaproteobacteria bacterium]|nr:PEP-CTERM system histidine kinase PrsK [Gammaproteobacteria bacterium]
VRAIAQIVNSPGGAVWVRPLDETYYVPAGNWHCGPGVSGAISSDAPMIRFLRESQWVVDLDEMRKYPQRYNGQTGDDLPDRERDWWLIVPMLLGERLTGFIMLLRPNIVPVLNFEDHDLLKTAGRHVATHIEQAESDRRLAEASQFGAYNRLTAFLMHDLNNLLAQQSLVVENAERFRHNPEFVDDAINTIAHSVARMRRLMEQLSAASKPPVKRRVNLCKAIGNAVERTSSRKPVPELLGCPDDIDVQADTERLSMVIEHLLRNAQEATPADGSVTIEATATDEMARITIADTGSGMSQEFIRTRLFRPFDSTKGSQGMGIGAYQARTFVVESGGSLEVESEPNEGTNVRIRLPVSQ